MELGRISSRRLKPSVQQDAAMSTPHLGRSSLEYYEQERRCRASRYGQQHGKKTTLVICWSSIRRPNAGSGLELMGR